MGDFYMGQIMMTGFGFAQKYFAQCNGQIMGIAQNQALFSLLGTTYGGDGSSTFALPDLRSRTPAGGFQSQSASWQPPVYVPGQIAGVENVTLTQAEMPLHSHQANVTSAPGTAQPSGRAPGLTLASAAPTTFTPYGGTSALTPINPTTLAMAGGNQQHPNLQPYLAINFNIALSGIYPTRN